MDAMTMTLNRLIKLFVPPIAFKMRSRRSKFKPVVVESTPLPQIEHHSEKMILIGNGPSLRKTMDLYKDEIIKNDRMAANFFASSDLYGQLQPNFYLFADPAFFNVPDNQKRSIEALVDSIIDNTTWPMLMIVPSAAKGSELINRVERNTNISVGYYYSGNQDVGSMSKFEAWDKNLICPPSQNVMNVALYLSLYWSYKETYLIGADSSFLADLRVDQETNELYTVDTHFYNNKAVYTDKKFYDQKGRGRSRSDWKLHDLIYAHGRMFEYYYDLKQYADYKGLKVYNASEYSWINVFERKKLI